jgi:hypothetical protein
MVPVANVVSAESPTAQGFDVVNEQLKGKVAVIDLADGTTIKKAKKVVVESNFTYWSAKAEEQRVETTQVVRIQARSKSKSLVWLGGGAALGGLLSYASGSGECDQSSDPWCTSDAEGGYALLGAGFGALLGFAVSKAIPRKRQVVYAVPGSISAEPTADPPPEEGLNRPQ